MKADANVDRAVKLVIDGPVTSVRLLVVSPYHGIRSGGKRSLTHVMSDAEHRSARCSRPTRKLPVESRVEREALPQRLPSLESPHASLVDLNPTRFVGLPTIQTGNERFTGKPSFFPHFYGIACRRKSILLLVNLTHQSGSVEG